MYILAKVPDVARGIKKILEKNVEFFYPIYHPRFSPAIAHINRDE